MPGETEDRVSAWTTDTLHMYMQRQLDDMRRMLDERYATQTKAVDAAFAAQQLALAAGLLSINARLELLNELRVGVATKGDIEALEKLVNSLLSRLDRSEGKGTGLQAGWVYLLGAIAAIGTIVSLYLALRG